MEPELYVRSGQRRLRCGITTGTCAALAAAGALRALFTGEEQKSLSLMTPKGVRVRVEPAFCSPEGKRAACGVRKEAGDDPDVTDGLVIIAEATLSAEGFLLEAGEGIGRVTKPGLDQPVGAAAINSVPRGMIREAVREVCEEQGYEGGVVIRLSIPGGEEAAAKTFNPQLGIVGGLSVLGTSGIVEPMSEQAILDTIAVEIRQKAAEGSAMLILTPGNYGMDFLERSLPELKDLPKVRCSNYVGDALDMAFTEGFQDLLLLGHVGKLVKLAAGLRNTHSRMGDARAELFCAHAAACGAETALCRALMEQVSCDGCLELLEEAGLREKVMRSLMGKIDLFLRRNTPAGCRTGAVVFSLKYGLLGVTDTAVELIKGAEQT